MNEFKRIPVRVMRAEEKKPGREHGSTNIAGDSLARTENPPGDPRTGERAQPPVERREEIRIAADASPSAAPGGKVDWRDRALRLQAEMENYRRRQQRLAQDQIEAERERLLKAFLGIVDDLERALAAPSRDGGLREGVQLTHRAALQQLKKEDVERIEAEGQRFDPAWHDAVSTVPGRQVGAAPETIVRVLEPGYRLGDRLLRPARVVVAI